MTERRGLAELRSPTVLLATWGGAGLSPVAPGTVGSLAAMPLIAALQWVPIVVAVLIMLVLTIAGVVASDRLEARWGGHDHSEIVIDEVVGQWLAIALPMALVGDWLPVWMVYLGGFFAFRAFDVIKPFPVSWLDRRVPGGLGVMADDIMAGVMAGSVVSLMSLLML